VPSTILGNVESLWRYPVKSMRGEELSEVFVGAAGFEGDRLYAFRSSASRPEFPYFTARDAPEMLSFQPRFANAGIALMVDMPTGERIPITDPSLLAMLGDRAARDHRLELLRSGSAMVDAYPISLISIQTVLKISTEAGAPVDKRRFRANIYFDFHGAEGFAEDTLVGRSIRIGRDVVCSISKRDVRCKVITLDPDTGEALPALLKTVAQHNGGTAGVYASVITEGVVKRNDAIELID
jgi:uncharacterized protein YcbX